MLLFKCPNHKFDEPTLMTNIYNGINPNICGLLDVEVGRALMSRYVEDAKSIIKCMAADSFACGDLDHKHRKQPEDTAEENHRLK